MLRLSGKIQYWRFAVKGQQSSCRIVDIQNGFVWRQCLLPAAQQCYVERTYATPSRKPSFISQIVDNIKQEMAKSKQMKESLKKFREEAEKLEHSEALQKARHKFQSVESEASRGTDVIKEKLGTIKDKLGETLEEARKTEIAKKAGQISEEIGKSARGAAETITEQSHRLGKSGAFQTLSQTASAVKREIDESRLKAHMYQPLVKLRKRKETSVNADDPIIAANTEATGMELHKDSKFYQSWQNFRDNNPYVNKVLDWKTKFDESDNPMIRASRLVTDKITDIMGGLFQKTELSEALTEICKMDPTFNKEKFLKECETDIIPNILEALARGDLEVLKDWCYEAPYNVLSQPIKQIKSLGYKLESKILDIDSVDLNMGKMMDQGPVLVISFSTQQIMCVRDTQGNIVEGDPEKILRVFYVWVLCRDQTELDPKAAWRLLDLSANSTEQFL